MPLPELAALGVRRVSTGSVLFRAALHAATEAAELIRTGGVASPPLTYDAVQHLVADQGVRRPTGRSTVHLRKVGERRDEGPDRAHESSVQRGGETGRSALLPPAPSP